MQLPMRQHTRGFTLVEVLVALLIISIGLLGIAKMQALALSNTNGGRLRALAAIEADSLNTTMTTERNYWGTFTTAQSITVTGANGSSTVTSTSDSTLNGTVTCTGASTSSTSITPCTGGISCTSVAAPCRCPCVGSRSTLGVRILSGVALRSRSTPGSAAACAKSPDAPWRPSCASVPAMKRTAAQRRLRPQKLRLPRFSAK